MTVVAILLSVLCICTVLYGERRQHVMNDSVISYERAC